VVSLSCRVYPVAMTVKSALRTVFLGEAWVVNGACAVFCFFFPAVFLGSFASNVPAAAVEIVRWYGVLLAVLAVVVIRALPSRDDRVLKPALEGLLFGDLAHLAACVLYFQVVPAVTFPFLAMVALSVVLAGCRITWLSIDFVERRGGPTWNI